MYECSTKPPKGPSTPSKPQMLKSNGTSNCPLCSVGHAANKNKIWKFSEMDADHVSAWSKGGVSSAENCQMLCCNSLIAPKATDDVGAR